VLAAVTVCVPTSRVQPARRARILDDLVAAGHRLSGDVAWLPAFHTKRQ
jgi:DNA-binding IclR family transcriptional regulator